MLGAAWATTFVKLTATQVLLSILPASSLHMLGMNWCGVHTTRILASPATSCKGYEGVGKTSQHTYRKGQLGTALGAWTLTFRGMLAVTCMALQDGYNAF